MPVEMIRWQQAESPEPGMLLRELAATGRTYAEWSNGPYDRYAAHSHEYDKHLVCLQGSIVFSLPGSGEHVELRSGDQLWLPAGTAHAADVGARGVRCAEAHLARG